MLFVILGRIATGSDLILAAGLVTLSFGLVSLLLKYAADRFLKDRYKEKLPVDRYVRSFAAGKIAVGLVYTLRFILLRGAGIALAHRTLLCVTASGRVARTSARIYFCRGKDRPRPVKAIASAFRSAGN